MNRDQVVVFADICDSTGLFERYGDSKARQIIATTLQSLILVVNSRGGTLIKTIGDEIMCVFGSIEAAVPAVVEMQNKIKEDPQLVPYNIVVRIGLHYGSVLMENNDVFGDTVNVAARVTDLAGPNQIVATRAVVDGLDGHALYPFRDLGNVRLRGKQEETGIAEIIWQQDIEAMTTANPIFRDVITEQRSYLQLSYKGRTITADLAQMTAPLRIGRDYNNDMIVNHDLVSRNHALVERRNDYFVFVDRSTNGSYIQADKAAADTKEYYIHRDELPLRDTGVISLGQRVALDDTSLLLHYECHYE